MIKKILFVLFILVMIPVLVVAKWFRDIFSGDPNGPKTLNDASRMMVNDFPRKHILPTPQGYVSFMTPEQREWTSEHFARLIQHAERQEAVPSELERAMVKFFFDIERELHPADRGNYYIAFAQTCEVTNTQHLIPPAIVEEIDRYITKVEKYNSGTH